MGSVKMPSSSWQPQLQPQPTAGKEEIQFFFDFGGVQQVKEVYIFLDDGKRTRFDVFGGMPNKWELLSSYDNDPATHVHFCSWEKIKLGNTSTRFLKFVFSGTESKGKIGEILVVSSENRKIEPISISVNVEGEEGAYVYRENNPERLIDEQGVVKIPTTQKYGAYFDEMYFVRTAYEHFNLEEPSERTHPPLGKLIIALGILCFGMNPFGWRILGVLVAAAMIPIMFLFGKKMFKSSEAGFFSAFLLTFDFMHFSLSRLATGEIYILLFSLLMFYFFFDYFSRREAEAVEKVTGISLFLSIIFFGLCFSVKWTAFFGFISILALLLIRKSKGRDFGLESRMILAGLFVSGAIYLATYVPYMLAGHSLLDVLTLQLYQFGAHAGLKATHPFSSPWWSWILMLKPLWMYSNSFDGMVSTIALMGNPAIWWGSIPALILIGTRFVIVRSRRKEQNYVFLFILIPFLLQWLPHALIPRILFIYHFDPNVPFMIFAITYWLNELWKNFSLEKKPLTERAKFFSNPFSKRVLVISFLILTALLFFLFYPVISGYPVSYEYIEKLRWLRGWVF
jgi:dolichyl-phosphate-mannose--protein O-mannosyl transferase